MTDDEGDSGLCDCDPEHKEVRTVQRSKGASIGPLGGRHGDGTTVIVCKNCGKRFYEDDSDSGPLSGQGPL